MKKIAIIGASYLQRPLVEKAKELGHETYVFAWEEGNVVDDITDYYYPISILEKEAILEKCQKVKIDGITSIASDIAMPTVNYIAEKLDLVGNGIEATLMSTDKYEMRSALLNAGVPCPKFRLYKESEFDITEDFQFPLIVKPTDRSGARGVTKVDNTEYVNSAIKKALDNSIHGRAIVEEYIDGREFSVEMISFNGEHFYLTTTDKVTTGAPYFVEEEHHVPAQIDDDTKNRMRDAVQKALTALGIKNGASHSEILLTTGGAIQIVEIAGRMGGDFIGSELVRLSTGYDFVRGVIQVALSEFEPVDYSKFKNNYAGVYYVLPKSGKIKGIKNNAKDFDYIDQAIPILQENDNIPKVIDSAGKRAGVIVYVHPNRKITLNPSEVLEFTVK